jgi:subtilase family serine protease
MQNFLRLEEIMEHAERTKQIHFTTQPVAPPANNIAVGVNTTRMMNQSNYNSKAFMPSSVNMNHYASRNNDQNGYHNSNQIYNQIPK